MPCSKREITPKCLASNTVCHRGKHFELAACQSSGPGTISLGQIIGERRFGEQRHKEVGWDDNKPGGSRPDGCDDFIAADRASGGGACARAQRASSEPCVRPIKQNYQRYIVDASIYRQ